MWYKTFQFVQTKHVTYTFLQISIPVSSVLLSSDLDALPMADEEGPPPGPFCTLAAAFLGGGSLWWINQVFLLPASAANLRLINFPSRAVVHCSSRLSCSVLGGKQEPVTPLTSQDRQQTSHQLTHTSLGKRSCFLWRIQTLVRCQIGHRLRGETGILLSISRWYLISLTDLLCGSGWADPSSSSGIPGVQQGPLIWGGYVSRRPQWMPETVDTTKP